MGQNGPKRAEIISKVYIKIFSVGGPRAPRNGLVRRRAVETAAANETSIIATITIITSQGTVLPLISNIRQYEINKGNTGFGATGTGKMVIVKRVARRAPRASRARIFPAASRVSSAARFARRGTRSTTTIFAAPVAPDPVLPSLISYWFILEIKGNTVSCEIIIVMGDKCLLEEDFAACKGGHA